MKFDLTENGYSVEQVDAYLSRIKQVYEEIIKKQREYLDKLKEENGELLTKNKKFEEEKETLAKAIKNAIDKSDELNNLMTKKVSKEIASLRSFRTKWSDYLQKLEEQYPVDDKIKHAKEMDGLIGEAMDQIESEDEGEPFDYNEAIHPTESLAELLKSFGIDGEK